MSYTPAYSPGDILSASAMNSIGEAWTSFGSASTTWMASVGAPSAGNATWQAAYCRINKLVFARYYLKIGSTTSVGAGVWLFGLPFTAADTTAVLLSGQGFAVDGTTPYAVFPNFDTADRVYLWTMALDFTFTYKPVSPSDPFNFGTNDFVTFSLAYECA